MQQGVVGVMAPLLGDWIDKALEGTNAGPPWLNPPWDVVNIAWGAFILLGLYMDFGPWPQHLPEVASELSKSLNFRPWPQHLPDVASELSNGASILANNTPTLSAIKLLAGN